jgi:molecular chaperone DnaJ
VSYEIPEGTQTGTTFTIREKGIPSAVSYRRRGDHKFTVVVETPTKLSREQKDLLRQLDDGLDSKCSPKRKKFIDILKDIF